MAIYKEPVRQRCIDCNELFDSYLMWGLVCEGCTKIRQESKSVNARLWELEKAMHDNRNHQHMDLMRF